MTVMNDTDYKDVLRNSIARLLDVHRQRQELDNEFAKLRQFIMATINMLPDEERDSFIQAMDNAMVLTEIDNEGLKAAIMRVLREAHPRWLTAANVRDSLKASGFDFTQYTSNPLASVSTTLRRLKDGDAEFADTDGVTSYRFNKKRFSEVARERMGRLRDMS